MRTKRTTKRKLRRWFFLFMRSRTPPISSWIPLWNSNGVDSHVCHYAYATSCLGERKKKFHCWGGIAGGEGFSRNKMSENRTLVRLLRMYFPRNWQFGSACQNFRISAGMGELNTQNPPQRRYVTESNGNFNTPLETGVCCATGDCNALVPSMARCI